MDLTSILLQNEYTKHSKELKSPWKNMGVDLGLFEILGNSKSNSYIIYLNNKEYSLEDVSIVNSPTPVNSPTTRGGVYFSDKFAFKIRGTIHDLSVIPFLTKTMLGPNTEFGMIKITTQINSDPPKTVLIHANLTNSVQTKSGITLNMIVVELGYS